MAKQVLGRGMENLIPKDFDSSILEEDTSRVHKLLISDILPNTEQPRSNFSVQHHNELVDSVKRHGVLQPVIVIRRPGGYKLVAGERRWRAAKDAQLTHIPAIVRSLKELEQLEIALIENIQRVDLSPLEEALAISRLQQQFSLALDQIAIKLGKAPSTISNITRLLKLPPEAQVALRAGHINEGHARAVLALDGQTAGQAELLGHILAKKWTVRQAEQFVTAAKQGLAGKKAVGRTIYTTPFTTKLSEKIKLPVSLRHSAKGGQLLITFKSQKQLEKLEDFLLGKK